MTTATRTHAADLAELAACAYRRLALHLDRASTPTRLASDATVAAETARLRTEAGGDLARLGAAAKACGEEDIAGRAYAEAAVLAESRVPLCVTVLRARAESWDAYALRVDPAAGSRAA